MGKDILALDFETYYGPSYTLDSMTTESYLRDPRFQVNLCSIKVNDAPAIWAQEPKVTQFFDEEVDWPNVHLLAQHAHFDAGILAVHYGKQPGGLILDTISMDRIVRGPKVAHDLGSQMLHYLGRTKRKEVLHMAWNKRISDFSGYQLRDYGDYSCEDNTAAYEIAAIQMPQCSLLQLQLIDLKIRMFTDPVFIGNTALLDDAVRTETVRKAGMLARFGGVTREQYPTEDAFAVALLKFKKQFGSSEKFAEILRSLGVEPGMKPGKPKIDEAGNVIPKMIYAFAKTDPAMQELLEDDDDTIRFLAETRLEMKSTIILTRAQRMADMSRRGPMMVYIKPNGTHTQRAAAGDGSNFMNLTSVNKFRPEMTAIKRSLEAPAGCKVVSVDSSQIQARLTVWLAGQDDIVQAFAEGRDVYSEFATEIYRRLVNRKKVEADFIPGQVGKVAVLSYGFGKNWFGAARDFLKGQLGAPPIQFTETDMRAMGVDENPFLNNPKKVGRVSEMISRLPMEELLIHCIVTEATVQRWRAVNYKVAGRGKQEPGMWQAMEQIIDAMIRGNRMEFGPRGFLHTEKECIVAPSGARLVYHGLQRDEKGAATYWNGRAREHIYFGSLTNNVIQLLEQEIIGAQMVEIHQAGIKIATEAYDNIVAIVPDAYTEQAKVFMMQTMTAKKDWYYDLPLAAEGGIAQTWYEAKS